jgi:hypothetical protein
MANKIILKKSSVAAKVPLSTDLDVGEIAVNLVDQKLYSKKADGTVVVVGNGIAGAGTVSSVGGTGTVNGITLTGTVTTTGNLTLGGALSGVNLTTQVTGTLPVASGGTGNTTAQAEMNRVAGAVTAAQYLRGNGTNVVMSAIQAADVPTLNQSTTGSAATLTTARTINGTSFNGSANITTANWGTARTLWGQSVNGSANITAPLLPAAGTAALPAFSTSGDTNTGMFFPAADTIAFAEGGVEVVRIDSSGNLGVGVVPSAWASYKVLQVNNGSVANISNAATVFGQNWFWNGTTTNYINDGFATQYIQQTGLHRWLSAPSGTAGASFTATELMRLTASGDVGIGTSTPGAALHVAGAITSTPTGNGVLLGIDSGVYGAAHLNGSSGGYIDFSTSGVNFKGRILYQTSIETMSFFTNATERMRITSSGDVGIGTSSPAATLDVVGTVKSSSTITGTTFIPTNGFLGKAGTGGATSNIFNINWTGSSAQLWIDATNVGTFAFTSDYRIKRNIQTQTRPALERVMQLRPVTYQMANYGTLFKQNEEIKEGFIAHEVQAVIPSGVDGAKDDETKIQSLRLDAMLAVAIKAIQELKTEFDAYKASHP